jgi:predicted GIY-YIG superfamily endonuclease
MGSPHFVYVIRSRADRTRYYTGLTSNVAARLAAHNAGRRAHTAKAAPWEIVVVVEFVNEHRAVAFEKYLKSGSGVAFSMRHLR